MHRSEAWADIQPPIWSQQSSSMHSKKYLPLPDRMIDILIDASEQYFIEKAYKLPEVRKYCTRYLKDHNYTLKGSEPIIEKVVHYFDENRVNMTCAREKYAELTSEILLTGDSIKSLPGGVCNKIRYLLALEHYQLNHKSIAPGENQE